MGFWSTVGNVAKGLSSFVANETSAAVDRNKQYNEEMSEKDDIDLEKIFAKYLNSKPLMALAAGKELKNRGYTQEDLSQLSGKTPRS